MVSLKLVATAWLCFWIRRAATSGQPALCINIMSWGSDTDRLNLLDCYITQHEKTGPIFTPSLSNTYSCTCTQTQRHAHMCHTETYTHSHKLRHHWYARELQKPLYLQNKNKNLTVCSQVGGVLNLTFNRWCLPHFSWKKKTGIHHRVVRRPLHTAGAVMYMAFEVEKQLWIHFSPPLEKSQSCLSSLN